MSDLVLSWVIGFGAIARGGNKRCPTWDEVAHLLGEAGAQSGSVTLDIIPAPEVGSQSLQVFVENGLSVLLLGVIEDDEYNVRTYYNHSPDSEYIEIGGDLWDGRSVCDEFGIVIRCFREFFDRRDVTSEYLPK